ncbi:phosphoglycerate mutase [Amycolatopsis bartoniae]|uniref:phosphoglycerate mutase (2,3-diphosphoglycerate-dependent) n=2 Tax=Amycolatopsis bartoniae TaxID=941986 RepID=A0A8H9MF47_9PSEU|nr:phosphoglycerate mutase [Amycolatopsis bartoniae]
MEWVGLLRHGQSTGNVAREEAESDGREVIDIAERDADVPLTELGAQQAEAAGDWLVRHPVDVVVASPYVRSAETARIALAAAARQGARVPEQVTIDERLRDRELGVLDLLTTKGVRERWPDELRRKQRHGKFYYRPPGGESWADVVLRLRSLLRELHADAAGQRVLLVAHEMTVFALRYLLEGVPEPELLRIAARTEVSNGSFTAWQHGADGRYRLTAEQETGHLHAADTPPTEDDDAAASLA